MSDSVSPRFGRINHTPDHEYVNTHQNQHHALSIATDSIKRTILIHSNLTYLHCGTFPIFRRTVINHMVWRLHNRMLHSFRNGSFNKCESYYMDRKVTNGWRNSSRRVISREAKIKATGFWWKWEIRKRLRCIITKNRCGWNLSALIMELRFSLPCGIRLVTCYWVKKNQFVNFPSSICHLLCVIHSQSVSSWK